MNISTRSVGSTSHSFLECSEGSTRRAMRQPTEWSLTKRLDYEIKETSAHVAWSVVSGARMADAGWKVAWLLSK